MSAPVSSTGRILWPVDAALAGSLAGTELAELRSEEAKLGTELGTLKRQLSAAETVERPAAVKADRDGFARAIRQGLEDPGAVEVTKLEARLAADRRRQAALEQAIRSVQHDVEGLLHARGAEYLEDAESLEAEAKAELRSAVDRLAKAAEVWTARRLLLAWLDGDRTVSTVPVLARGLHNESWQLADVVAGLKALVED